MITTPHDFIWRVKNPEDYWSDSFKDVKYIVYLDGKKRGFFAGVNRTFEDDMYYVNFYNADGEYNYCSAYMDAEMVLEKIKD